LNRHTQGDASVQQSRLVSGELVDVGLPLFCFC